MTCKEWLFWVTNKAAGAKTHKQREIFLQIIQIIKMQFSAMENPLDLWHLNN